MTLPRTSALATVLSAVVALASSGCSSVPDITYGNGGTTSSGGSSGAPQPEPLPDWACPDKPPPDGQGVCCGNRICLKCSASDCPKCEQEGCGGTVSATCCRRNPQQMQCKAANEC